MGRILVQLLFASGACLCFLHSTVNAELVRFEIKSKEVFAGGASFGDVGAYEKIIGRAYFALDPLLEQNEQIVDLKLASRNESGKVEFWADLFILAPQDLSRGNGALLYDVNNRGNKLALGMFNYGGSNNPTTLEHAGDGFLMRNGFTIVWSGWDGELLPGGDRLRLTAPVAKSKADPVKGLVRCEFVGSKGMTRSVVNWANHGSYRPTETGLKTATLTGRERPSAPREVIPNEKWKMIVSEVSSDSPTQLPNVEVEMPEGMKAGYIYELIYEASDPLVMGVGFASVRDLLSSIKAGTGEGNPLVVNGKPMIHRAHGFGVSQSGRFLREFLYSGFNEDEKSRRVFDGLMPHVAGGGLGSFNHRFAQPTRHSNQHDHHDYPPDRFPFAYEEQIDPLSGRLDGILKRALASNTAPLVMHTQSTGEYWTRSGSLVHTDSIGTRDSKPLPGVRYYTFGGTQHGPSGFPPTEGNGKNLANPADYKPFLRALLLALDSWSKDGKEPPPSIVPTISGGTLVDWRHQGSGFPSIPGIRYPEIIQQPHLLDFGPRWESEKIIDFQPPRILGDYRVLVPRCGADGNELGCLSPIEVAVPLATYTGWNLRKIDVGAEDQLVSLTGSFIPFAVTKEEREILRDPRPSIIERYGSLDAYESELTKVAKTLAEARYLVESDVPILVKRHRDRASRLFEMARKQQVN